MMSHRYLHVVEMIKTIEQLFDGGSSCKFAPNNRWKRAWSSNESSLWLRRLSKRYSPDSKEWWQFPLPNFRRPTVASWIPRTIFLRWDREQVQRKRDTCPYWSWLVRVLMPWPTSLLSFSRWSNQPETVNSGECRIRWSRPSVDRRFEWHLNWSDKYSSSWRTSSIRTALWSDAFGWHEWWPNVRPISVLRVIHKWHDQGWILNETKRNRGSFIGEWRRVSPWSR